MKKFAKWIAVFAAAAMVVTGLAACGDKPNDGGGNSGGKPGSSAADNRDLHTFHLPFCPLY